MKTQKGRSFGFTLIEMIGMLSVIAILSLIIVPLMFKAIEDVNKQKLAKLLGTNVVAGVETVGNMTFLRTDTNYRDNDSIRSAMMHVDTFERENPELEVTSRQLVVDPNFRLNFLLNHRPRVAN